MRKTRTGKKALSLLLTLCMVLSLLPAMGVTASASGVTPRTAGLLLVPDTDNEYNPIDRQLSYIDANGNTKNVTIPVAGLRI